MSNVQERVLCMFYVYNITYLLTKTPYFKKTVQFWGQQQKQQKH